MEDYSSFTLMNNNKKKYSAARNISKESTVENIGSDSTELKTGGSFLQFAFWVNIFTVKELRARSDVDGSLAPSSLDPSVPQALE